MHESVVLQGIRSAMCVPLWNNKEVIGLIYVDTLNQGTSFRPEDLQLLTLLANIAAVKIEKAPPATKKPSSGRGHPNNTLNGRPQRLAQR